MKHPKIIIFTFLILIVVLSILSRPASPASLPISYGYDIGTGTIISTNGYVLTNRHVVEDLKDGMPVLFYKGDKIYSGYVVARDETSDLALLKITASYNSGPLTFTCLPVHSHSDKIGDKLRIVMFDHGFVSDVTFHHISIVPFELVKINMNAGIAEQETNMSVPEEIYPGNSGSPVIDQDNNLIGVMWGAGSFINLSVSNEAVIQFIQFIQGTGRLINCPSAEAQNPIDSIVEIVVLTIN